ncbi:MAG: NAD(P)H-dependent oxidoreductase [Pyrinomonadaceae bacterium]
MKNDELVERLNWRYAVKRFDPNKKISPDDMSALEESLRLAPSSYGLQPWRFHVIASQDVKDKLRAHSWNQPQISECSHLVVISARQNMAVTDVERYLDRIVEVRGTDPAELEILKGMMLGSHKTAVEGGFLNEWAARQCFIALGFLLNSAAVLGIDACPMEGFVPEEYDRELGISDEGYFPVVACAIGYRDESEDWLSKLDKVRYDKDEVFRRV